MFKQINFQRLYVFFAVVLIFGVGLGIGPVPLARADTPLYVRPGGDDALCDGTVDVDHSAAVAPNCAVKTIQKGVDLVDAGGAIYVAAGTYAESVTINQSLMLYGAQAGNLPNSRTAGDSSESIIDATGFSGGVTIKASNVIVDGFDIVGDTNTIYGVYIAAGDTALSSISVTNNFIHGMAKENTNASPRSYGILADAKAADPSYASISDLNIIDNEIYDLGGTSTAGGFGISLHEIAGENAGDGAEITGNVIHNIKDDTGGLNAFGTAVSVFLNASADGGQGGPSSGVLITNNTYSDLTTGVSVLADNSTVSEAHSSFNNVPLMVVNLSAPATNGEIDEPALAPYAKSNKLTLLEALFPGSEGYFVTIQDAINASDPDATVAVSNGIFHENIVIDKSLSLQAEANQSPIIDGNTNFDTTPDGDVVTIAADSVAIDGFELRNGYNGILLDHSNDNFIGNNVIHDNGEVGILLRNNSNGNIIADNTIFANGGQGILFDHSNDNYIGNNVIHDNALYGIHLWYADAGFIKQNQIFNHNGQGIYLTTSNGSAILDNDIYHNDYGVSVDEGSADTYLAGNIIHDNAKNGLTIFDEGSASTLVNFNQFCRNAEYGMQHLGLGENTPEIDATYNWWGSASGPDGVGPGSGDHVSAGVTFGPWDSGPPTNGPCHLNSIHVQKYEDLDGSGDKSEDEPGLNGWLITLYNDQGQELMNDTTHSVGDEDGWVLFEGLAPGNYTVCETLQDGWNNSDPGVEPACKPITVTDQGLAPGSGPLFTFIDAPGNDSYSFTPLSLDMSSPDLSELEEGDLLNRVGAPWLCVLGHLTEPDPQVLVEQLLAEGTSINLPLLLEFDPAVGFDNDLYYLSIADELFAGPVHVGVKTWRGSGGYSTATGFIDCGYSAPTVLFGNNQPGSIKIVKEASQAGKHGFEFTFAGDNPFFLQHHESKMFTDLAPGNYTVTENPVSFPDEFWTLLSVSCQEGEHPPFYPEVIDFGDSIGAVIPVQSGQHLTCTFLNDRASFEGNNTYRLFLPLIHK